MTGTTPPIVGVVLVRNEDRFLARALENTAAFCDRYLLFDHLSRDGSARILEQFAASHPHAEVQTISHPGVSQAALQPLAGKRCWVFGIDGDEIYDPRGLARFKPRLLGGEFDRDWMVMGSCLHMDDYDERQGIVSGYLAPPSRSITKLYNFSAIERWEGPSMERLHGGTPVFRAGFDAGRKRLLQDEVAWEEADLRCLHLCFCRRSSLDPEHPASRMNIDEIYNARLPILKRMLAHFRSASTWKRERYRRGPRVTKSGSPFFE